MTAIASHLALAAVNNDDGDADLLRRYLRDGDRDAFSRLVQRHLAMVYAAARRMLRPGNLGDVEDVTQAVFILLARKAGTIRPGVSLAAWLYSATRMTAANARRSALRRRRHEHEAGGFMRQQRAAAAPASSSSSSNKSLTWAEIEPELDEALSRLRPRDREAIVLRFLASHSLREVGDAIGISEDAARVRVNRALVRLRQLMGATVPAISIATALDAGAAHAVATVPAHLAATIAASALAPVAGTTAAALAGTTAATMTPAGLKVAAIAIAAVMVAGVGTAGVVAVVRSSAPPAPTTALNIAPAPSSPVVVTPATPAMPATTTRPSPDIPANSPQGITLALLRAGAAGDRAAMRPLMHIDGEIERRAADAGIEYLIAEGRLDAVVAAKFHRARIMSRLDSKIADITASQQRITGDRASLVSDKSAIHAFIRVNGQWKLIPSAALEESQPKPIERLIDETRAITTVFDETAAEIDVGQYPTYGEAMNMLEKRMTAALAASTTRTTAAPTTTTATATTTQSLSSASPR